MNPATRPDLALSVLRPRSIAVVGASDNPHKVGGRPIFYLNRFGYAGRVYAVNPNRPTIQGVKAYPDVGSLPEATDLAIVATPAADVPAAVAACAARGVSAAIVMTSGFSETQTAAGVEHEHAMAASAQAAGMRLVGPNTQGVANFHNGAIASFSTLFLDPVPQDGPVAIVSQSGVMSALPLTLLQRDGIGVRYSVATGNEADVTLGEMALAVLDDPDIRLLLLYLESIRSPEWLARAAARARERDVPIVAVKSGRTVRGQKAARSHTGALAGEDRVIDAFLRHHGIWRARDIQGLVRAAPLYLNGWRPAGRRLVVVSNSGASCVMAADTAHDIRLPLASLNAETVASLARSLPAFATTTNPIDLTAALLHDSHVLGKVLPPLAASDAADLFCIDLPVLGEGYDVEVIAGDTARFAADSGRPVAVVSPQRASAAAFRAAGLPTFENQTEALGALADVADHVCLMRRPPAVAATRDVPTRSMAEGRWLNEHESLTLLGDHGIPVVRHRLCRSVAEARAAFAELGPRVAVKACSRDVPHKSDQGLVALNVETADDVARIFEAQLEAIQELDARADGVIVAAMADGLCEMALGVTWDPAFGPLVMIAAGGTDIEAMDDAVLMMPPFGAGEVKDALTRLGRSRLLDGHRGAHADVDAFSGVAIRLGEVALGARGIRAIDVNPVLVGEVGTGVIVVDALVELSDES